ncbi:MAG: ECF transporter S component, partial [Candidatus Hodarchaeota archaeon]
MSSATELSMKDFITMREVALTATFTALVFLSTSLFYIALVSSTGFFNLGEAFVYLAALIGGPIVGAIAGGVGAALADGFLGYGMFAPATLILKGLEGFTTGSLYYFARNAKITIRRMILAVGTIFIILFSIYVTT